MEATTKPRPTEECLTCEETFELRSSHPMDHSSYCDDCGDPREGCEVDPGVYGPGPDRRFYDGGRLIDPDDPASLARI